MRRLSLLPAFTLCLSLAALAAPAARAADMTLQGDGTLTATCVAGNPFGDYNLVQAYPNADGSVHVDVMDSTGYVSHDYPAGQVKSIVADVNASGLYSMNIVSNYVPNVAVLSDLSSSEFDVIGSPYGPGVFTIGGQQCFGYIRHDTVVLGESGSEAYWYAD